MGIIKNIVSLMRVRQWYKGVVIFMGLFFGGKISFSLDNIPIIIGAIVGFFLVGLTSSLNYIINDLMDIEKDRVHPEKCKRPLASGALSKKIAYLLIGAISIIITFGSYFFYVSFINITVALQFLLIIGAIFLTGFLYNMGLKNQVFIDILVLSMNYIWRTMAGCYIAQVDFSPWLYILVYLVALFLAINKRIADMNLLGAEAINHKPIYKKYDMELLKTMLQMITISLFLTYTFYCILGPIANYSGPELSNNRGFVVTSVPIALYLILRYLYISKTKPEIARSAEKSIKDIPLVVSGGLLVIMIYIANYVDITIFLSFFG
jgi:4-hydroxybenzoate polyprenyltransferase